MIRPEVHVHPRTCSFSLPNAVNAGHSGCVVQGMNCLRRLKQWDRGFESHLRYGCPSLFILCLCCPVCR
jgi:hypothetical protein